MDANGALVADLTLEMAEKIEEVTVLENAAQVETASSQMGQVVTGTQMTSVALNGRSFTDLLALQPGIVPMSTQQPDSIVMAGASVAIAPSGGLNPGNQSISGQREDANGFMVNGGDVKELMNGGTTIVPDLDSIAEFRVLTNNVNAEYGNYSGGIVNVVTKVRGQSAPRKRIRVPAKHGSGRAQFLFAGPQLLSAKPVWRHGGRADQEGQDLLLRRLSGHADGAGNRYRTDSACRRWPSGRAISAASLSRSGERSVSGESAVARSWATPFPRMSRTTQVFPGGNHPATSLVGARAASAAIHSASQRRTVDVFHRRVRRDCARRQRQLSQWMPTANAGGCCRLTISSTTTALNNPYPTGQGGASVPGFNALTLGRAQLVNLGDTKTFGPSTVNELRLSYMRDSNNVGQPAGGVGPSLASQGFVTGVGTPGIVPLAPSIEGIENVIFNSFVMGTPITNLKQANNTYAANDNVSKVWGSHTFKAGLELSFEQVNVNPNPTFNGSFLFSGSETGIDFADFLIGVASNYNQADSQAYYIRHKYAGGFAQDSWRVTSSLTLNYGVRWDRMEYWSEKYNQIPTFIPGEQSVVYPTAPVGLVYVGDKGVPNTLVPSSNRFSPRLGLAYSPGAKDGLLAKITGGPEKTSIRAGYGIYYSVIEGNTMAIDEPQPPYGLSYTSPGPPLFATPFITASNGSFTGNPFPLTFPPLNASPQHPNSSIDFSQFEPIAGMTAPPPWNTYPYNENYFLSIERQFGGNTVLSVSYVGSQAHHLLLVYSANPGNPALCLALSQPSAVAPGRLRADRSARTRRTSPPPGRSSKERARAWGRPFPMTTTTRASATRTTMPSRSRCGIPPRA